MGGSAAYSRYRYVSLRQYNEEGGNAYPSAWVIRNEEGGNAYPSAWVIRNEEEGNAYPSAWVIRQVR